MTQIGVKYCICGGINWSHKIRNGPRKFEHMKSFHVSSHSSYMYDWCVCYSITLLWFVLAVLEGSMVYTAQLQFNLLQDKTGGRSDMECCIVISHVHGTEVLLDRVTCREVPLGHMYRGALGWGSHVERCPWMGSHVQSALGWGHMYRVPLGHMYRGTLGWSHMYRGALGWGHMYRVPLDGVTCTECPWVTCTGVPLDGVTCTEVPLGHM